MKLLASTTARRYASATMIALFMLPLLARAAAPAMQEKAEPTEQETAAAEQPQPKFIWGILLKFAASKVFEMLFDWASKKLFSGMELPSLVPREAAVSQPGDAVLAPVQKGGVVPMLPEVTDRKPSAPLTVENGKENYQGAILSLLVLQPDGETMVARPLSAGFKSGEKFRLRLGSTFAGDLTLDNIDPHGERSRLYPADTGQVVRIRAGVPVILPLEKDSFFQFDEDAGEEKLVVSLRDPRAQGEAAATAMVHRREEKQGTGLLQEVAKGKYAAIAESIALQHR